MEKNGLDLLSCFLLTEMKMNALNSLKHSQLTLLPIIMT